jgi:hypothetical protein
LPSCNRQSELRLARRCHRSLLILAVMLANLLPGAPVLAQTKEAEVPSRKTVAGRRRATLDDRVKQLAKGLDLNQEQQASVKKILEHRQQETMRIRLDSSISGSDRIDQFRALQDDTVRRIRAVLNDEQKKKYDPLAVRQIKPAENQRSVEDWLKATTPK